MISKLRMGDQPRGLERVEAIRCDRLDRLCCIAEPLIFRGKLIPDLAIVAQVRIGFRTPILG